MLETSAILTVPCQSEFFHQASPAGVGARPVKTTVPVPAAAAVTVPLVASVPFASSVPSTTKRFAFHVAPEAWTTAVSSASM